VKRGTLLFAAAVLIGGCATGRQLVSPRTEYRLYRRAALAPTVEERLGAANRYLRAAPNGVYAAELRSWFALAERTYVKRAHDELPLLLAYEKAMPDGPSIAEVESRIEELESAARFAKNRESARRGHVESLEANLERASTQRKAFIAELTSSIATLASVRSYGQALVALPPEALERFGIADPAAGCPLDVCVTTLEPRFAIPSAATQLIPREAAYSLELSLATGTVAGLRLHGRELFSRVGEALDLHVVSFTDPQSRAEAIGRALPLVENALGSALAAPGCERPAVSPVVFERSCDGVHVTVTAAIDPGEDDTIAFGPEAKPAPTPPTAPAPKTPRPKH
jgi:hypothetical protein